jgi:hypothetical protein
MTGDREHDVLLGKLRDAEGSKRGWRAKAYLASERYPYPRVRFKDVRTGRWETRAIPTGEDPEDYLRKLDRALDRNVVVEARSAKTTLSDLVEVYLRWLRDEGRDEEYVIKVSNLLSKWVLATHGDLAVEKWGPTHSQKWVGAMRKAKLSPSRIEDFGTALSGLKKTAFRRDEHGVRLLDPADDPTEGVSTTRTSTIEGAHRDYVPPRLRPTTPQAGSIIAAGAKHGEWGWEETVLRIGTYCGPRLAEQLALRDVDVDFVKKELRFRNTIRWPRPGIGLDMQLKPIKTKTRRQMPYPASLHKPLLALCRESLGLPANASVKKVTAAQKEKLDAKFEALDELTYKLKQPRPIEVDEGLLFCRPDTGLPPTKEAWGDRWRAWRDASTWPAYIPWRNARHHAVAFWRRVLVSDRGAPVDWEVIGLWVGNDPPTLQGHYQIPHEEASAEARATLDQY